MRYIPEMRVSITLIPLSLVGIAGLADVLYEGWATLHTLAIAGYVLSIWLLVGTIVCAVLALVHWNKVARIRATGRFMSRDIRDYTRVPDKE